MLAWIGGISAILWLVVSSNSDRSLSQPNSASRAPAQPLPLTGAFDSSDNSRRNSITVKTQSGGQHTLIKIERLGGGEVTRGFVRAGEQHKFYLPAGTYVLKTAGGSAWYGEKLLFGANTAYSKPDDTFSMVAPGEQWTVELIPQRDGNLRDRQISASEF